MSSSSICTSNASTSLLGSMAKKVPCWQGPILPPAAPWPSPLVLAGFYAQGERPALGRPSQTRALERAASSERTSSAAAISLPSSPQAWTEELMDSDRRPRGAAANASSVSAFIQARCYRAQPKGIHPVPQRLRVF